MLRLYITRHGETEWNIAKKMQGWKDSKLTVKGIENATALGSHIKGIDFKCIYCSSSNRAIHTAELIRGEREICIIQEDALREIKLGEWEGKTSSEIESFDREAYKNFWEKPHLYQRTEAESFFELRLRIEEVLGRIIKENSDGNILIVTHAVTLKTMMSIFKDLPIENIWDQPFAHGTCLSIIELDNNEVNIIQECDMSHIG